MPWQSGAQARYDGYVSPEGWIFVVGFRIFDVGLLVLWLVWFFRMRDDDAGPNDSGDDDQGGGPPVQPTDPSGGGGLGLLLPGTLRAERRLRDDTPHPRSRPRRGEPIPRRQPARARPTRPRTPVFTP